MTGLASGNVSDPGAREHVSPENDPERDAASYAEGSGVPSSTTDPQSDHAETRSTEGIPVASDPKLRNVKLELLKEILRILQQSSIVRVDHDLRARFWKMYKIEAEEFHLDFSRKCNGELDISLIFAGLFSAVGGTFVTALQPNLAADPNATTQVLLMMIVRSLNSTAFPGQTLELPQFTGPDRITVWVQSLLYASLGTSLFAALAAMLGKEWLSHYARVGERGTVEDRCIDRQRKLISMRVWQFDLVLACIPLLLQASLLLFGVALSAYMWGQQQTIATVIVATNVVGVVVYGFFILCALIFPDCPFHTPITELLTEAWTRFSRTVSKTITHSFPKPQDLILSESPATESQDDDITLVEKPHTTNQLDTPCVEWLLVTSTDSDVITTAARMSLEVEWQHAKINLAPMLQQLRETFTRCFSQHPSLVELLPFARDRALACGQAILNVYMERQMSTQPVWSTYPASGFGWLGRIDIRDDPDLRFICEALLALFPSNEMHIEDGLPDPDDPVPILPQTSFVDWFSHQMLFCVCGRQIGTRRKQYFATIASQWLVSDGISTRARANCILASAVLVGSELPLELLAYPDKSAYAKEYARMVLSNLKFPLPGSRVQQFHKDRERIRSILIRPFVRLQFDRAMTYDLESAPYFHYNGLHTWNLHLCRVICAATQRWDPEELIYPSAWAYRLQQLSPELPNIIHLIVSMACPNPGLLEAPALTPNGLHLSMMRQVWQIQLNVRIPSSFVSLKASDVTWILAIMSDARNGVSDPLTMAFDMNTLFNCLILLSEIPMIHAEPQCSELYDILLWSMTHPNIALRHAGLKLTRVLCGMEMDVDDACLSCLVYNMGGIENFCTALSSSAPVLYGKTVDSRQRSPEYYLWIIAFLDIVAALASREEWIQHVVDHFAPKCLAFANYMKSPVGLKKWNILPSIHTFIGWEKDFRDWKLSQEVPVYYSPGLYMNSYVRDVWRCLVQILLRCELHNPGFINVSSPDTLSPHPEQKPQLHLKLVFACAPWQICDSHPIPDSLIPAMMEFTQMTVRNQCEDIVSQNGVQMYYVQDACRVMEVSGRSGRPSAPPAIAFSSAFSSASPSASHGHELIDGSRAMLQL
ncbi:hypothetical protein EUX98_g5116 [Antrodiella citrinella]|uniref:DUF6535 domain-containing protein n=1 Tax=Antrodiella citrinella TaxID=2447956 RepID=A0A4S4MSC0_9APHY|nr:hypothetical protein EUX98_g5116 [Antrodiella citrinella]